MIGNSQYFNVFGLVVTVLIVLGGGSTGASADTKEQSHFSMETDLVPILRPKDFPEAALQLLRSDRVIVNCSRAEKLPVEQIPASWFVASEIHLDGPNETDLVVQARDLHLSPAPNRCLVGANVQPFWVFRRSAGDYSLALGVPAHDLRILKTRSKGFRDIQASAMTAVTGFSAIYKFDGERYKVFRTSSKPLG